MPIAPLLTWLIVFGLFFLPAAAAQEGPSRPSDSLLYRPTLQHIVDVQVARDGSALARALEDDNPDVRARAAFALASVQDTTTVEALLALLTDAVPDVRADAAFALGQMPVDGLGSALLDALAEETEGSVQRQLLIALGKRGDAASLTQLAALELPANLKAEQVLAVGRYGIRDVHTEAAITLLLDALGHPEAMVRENAAYYFGRVPETAPWASTADSLRMRLDALAPDDLAAMHLLLGLGRLEEEEDTPLLIRWLEDGTDWRVRTNAARALRDRASAPSVREALLAALEDPFEHVAIVAAEALAGADRWTSEEQARVRDWLRTHPDRWRIGSPLLAGLARQGDTVFVQEAFEKRREAENPLVYARALSALAQLPSMDAFNELALAAQHPDVRIAYAALEALKERWSRERTTMPSAPLYFDLFARAVRRQDLATVYAAAPALADSLFQPLGATRVLTATYRDLRLPDDVEAMTSILGALGQAGDTTAATLLRQEAGRPDPVIAGAAADALQALTGEIIPLESGAMPTERTIDWDFLREMGEHPELQLETENGKIVLALETESAPMTTQTLLQAARAGRYDGVPFHRVVPNFVVQGGDYTRRDGFGGDGPFIRSEFTRLPYRRGTAGIASAGKDTEGNQYFVVHSMQPH
ncbi:MAG: HEAT repeat domain-containing protein, partial [Rhodothermales bacterium]